MHRIDGPGATIDNKFTEGDPVGGGQATVVTADWLTEMQEEVVSVLSDQSIAPVKGVQNQLLTAIRSIFTSKKATQPQVDAGTDDTTFITPAKARNGFSVTLNTVGWIRLPTWLGGLTLSWHNSTVTSVGVTTSLPIAVATGFLGTWACHQGPKGVAAYSCSVSVSDAVKTTIDVTSSVAGAANFKVFVLSW